jgi:hypothetical protein
VRAGCLHIYSVINLINGICRSELAHLEPSLKLWKICQKMYQCVEMPSKININYTVNDYCAEHTEKKIMLSNLTHEERDNYIIFVFVSFVF